MQDMQSRGRTGQERKRRKEDCNRMKHEHHFVPLKINWVLKRSEASGLYLETDTPLSVVSACHCGAVKTRFATIHGGKYDE